MHTTWQKRAGVHVHDMQIAHWRCKFVLVGPKWSAKGAKVHTFSTMRHKMQLQCQKRAGVHVLYMQNRAGATDSGYFTSVASEMGTKSGWWVQNWRAKVHKVTKKLH